jgi:hypothetical protein
LDVIGPSFGRTGTMSMKAALERLGFGPCYHMSEVYEQGHVDAWIARIEGSQSSWDAIFAGFRATVDWPASAFWKSIKTANPSAKVVLTRRDPDQWYESISNTIFQALRAPTEDAERAHWRVYTRKLILEQTFGNQLDHDNVVAVLRAHEEDVIASVPSDELLVYEVGDGWEPLCEFLRVPVPNEPFPHSNTTDEFRAWTGLT